MIDLQILKASTENKSSLDLMVGISFAKVVINVRKGETARYQNFPIVSQHVFITHFSKDH